LTTLDKAEKLKSTNKSDWSKSTDEVLALRISSNKLEYDIKENVIIKIELKNLSKKKIVIDNIRYTLPGCSDGIKITQGDNKVSYCGPLKDLLAPLQTIQPGEVLLETVELNVSYWKGFNKKGRYSISYTYSNYGTVPEEQWMGSISSKTIIIEKN